jgi:hypothetical protein
MSGIRLLAPYLITADSPRPPDFAVDALTFLTENLMSPDRAAQFVNMGTNERLEIQELLGQLNSRDYEQAFFDLEGAIATFKNQDWPLGFIHGATS